MINLMASLAKLVGYPDVYYPSIVNEEYEILRIWFDSNLIATNID